MALKLIFFGFTLYSKLLVLALLKFKAILFLILLSTLQVLSICLTWFSILVTDIHRPLRLQ